MVLSRCLYLGAFCSSFVVGWGRTIGDWLTNTKSAESKWGWGLASAWGLAAFLVLSGPLVLVAIFSSTFVALFLLSGLAMAFLSVKENPWKTPTGFGLRTISIGVFLAVCLTYAGAVAAQLYNVNDDFAVYFAQTKMLLDTGTLADPFSLRLMMSLGGQQTLSTLVVAFLPWKYSNLLDEGIALLIIVGLIVGMVRGGDTKAWQRRLVLLMLVLTFSMPRINTGSALTGVALFMALFQTIDLITDRQSVGWRSALLLGGLIAAIATLRGHFIFLIAPLGVGFVLFRGFEDKTSWRNIIGEAGLTLLTVIIFLAPWWMVTYRSSGSFLYPLFKGTQRPEFETFDMKLPWLTTLQFTLGFFAFTIYLLLFCPICLMKAGRRRRSALVFAGVILAVSGLFLWKYTYGDYASAYRYLAPIGVAFAFYSAGLLAQQFAEKSGQVTTPSHRLEQSCWGFPHRPFFAFSASPS